MSLVATLLLVPAVAAAQESVTAWLEPVGDSGVSGSAVLTAAGDGTQVTLDVKGLAANATARATMHAGACDAPSASFSELPALEADADGAASATGSVLFRGTEAVALDTMADGEHVIVIQTDGVVACGVIPKAAPASESVLLPATGGVSWALAALAGVLGMAVLSAGLFRRVHRRS